MYIYTYIFSYSSPIVYHLLTPFHLSFSLLPYLSFIRVI
jgi:hypothetical protein